MPPDSASYPNMLDHSIPPPATRPLIKRSRKAVNCEPCRASKLKCDRARPCSSCVLRGTSAHCYQGDPRPESADTLHRHADHPASHMDPRREIARIRHSLVLLESHINHTSASSTAPWPCLEPAPRASHQDSLDHPHSSDFAPAMLAQPRTGNGGMYAGPTSAATHFAAVKSESDESGTDDDAHSMASEPPPSPIEDGQDFDLLSSLPDFALVDGLIKHYFETCQWENRHLHHSSFMNAWRRFKTNLNIVSDRLTLATVFVVMAIAVQFLPHSHPLLESLHDSPSKISERFYTLGCMSLARYRSAGRTYTLELIELLLLRTHYLTIIKDQCEDLWILRGELVSIAIAMGLHRDPGRWKMSGEVAERRRWAWWNIMLVERWQAFMFGRPLAICNHHFDTRFPGQFDSSFDPTGRVHLPQIHLFRLAEILGDIMDDAVSVRPVPYERVISQDQALQQWLETLPHEINLDDYQMARGLSSNELVVLRAGLQSLCIRIFYYHVRFTLHRPYAGPWRSHSTTHGPHIPQDPRWQASLDTAVSAAARLTHLVSHASPDFMANPNLAVPGHLHWGPFHMFSAAMFFSFQLIANPDQPGANLFRANIKRVLEVCECLRGIHVAEKAMALLEALAPLYDETSQHGGQLEERERERKKARVLSFVRRLAFPCHDSPAGCGSRSRDMRPGSGPSPNGSMSSSGMSVTPVLGSVALPGTGPPYCPPPLSNPRSTQVEPTTQGARPPPPTATTTACLQYHPHAHSHDAHPTDENVWGTSIGLDSSEWANFVNVVQPKGLGFTAAPPPPPPPSSSAAGSATQHAHTHASQPVLSLGIPVGPAPTNGVTMHNGRGHPALNHSHM